MKKNLYYVLVVIQFFGYVNCTKDKIDPAKAPLQPPPPDEVYHSVNTAPKVNAGNDLFIYTINKDTKLTGTYSDAENNVRDVKWTKISGPDSYKLDNEFAISTGVDQLIKGIYQFELSVTDSLGLSGKDTIKITVEEIQISANEIIITDRPWIFPWYNSIEVRQFSTLIPQNTAYKVYIRRESSPDWIQVNYIAPIGGYDSQYEYFVETRPDGVGMYTYGNLYIFYYGKDVSDTPDVKITF